MQMGFDKKLDKMKSLDNKNFLTFDPNNSKSMDMGNQKISLSQYKSGLKKNLLIDLEAEQAKNMPKKILTPGGFF